MNLMENYIANFEEVVAERTVQLEGERRKNEKLLLPKYEKGVLFKNVK